ncbi:Rad21/Rec8 N terminal domain protein [Talaromyces stipitatus ATCC 10500]|uniref:Rad21/Rec8 N terminal domain protein n=1 Tax=Talaromyces stipitatus (strain ATCC 10500 / CBS 375.48 / QM 6759 / NRRL 1006) TaxID=441959 RepID=B8ML10_TALSN|nr:Rad21/Rec8 N terminal domain protein [Talaromyces stipitatus ATCC 10500]EED15426.1 Rad21/Rec8 N terminal domain protein [Talaromyces stipitatus ATCC 10500]
MSPEAPMALRLQGNLLYGVTKVYSRQCVYTLADVQAMLDKMKTALKVVHDRGLQADAGKARPEELIVPYDPAFIPDFAFPVVDLELLNPLGPTVPAAKLDSSLLSSKMSDSSHSQLELITIPQLDVDTSGTTVAGFGGFSFASGSSHSPGGQNLLDIGGEEEGILLQPDFDFDEEGNIVDLVMADAPAMPPATPVRDRVIHEEAGDVLQGPQEIEMAATTPAINALDDVQIDAEERGRPSPTWGRLPDPDYVDRSRNQNASSSRKRRAQNMLQNDVLTQISRDELLQWDQEYLQHMSRLDAQRANAKGLARARKNAAAWITGRGIGSVGLGIGVNGLTHPLESFCGDSLLAALSSEPPTNDARKRSSREAVSEDEEGHDRSVRRRISDAGVEVGLSHPDQLAMQEDVELGLDAPPSLPDDASSQMPWNITASLQGSVAGSSSVPRPFNGYDSSSRRYRGFGRPGSRFSSASPLARRGLPRDLFGRDSLSSLSLRDFGEFHDDDDLGDFPHATGSDGFAESSNNNAFESQVTLASLDNNDRNFLDYLQTRVQGTKVGRDSPGIQKISFSELLPPTSTSRAVATQALLHVLTLATKNVIQVSQGKRCRGAPYAIDDLHEIRLSIRD